MAHRPPNKSDAAPVASDSDETFIQRWARLKEESRATPGAKDDVQAPPAPDDGPAADRKRDDKPSVEEKPFDVSQLPPIDSLTKDSDFSLFMRPEVPDDMRNKALRRLWALDAALAQPDWLEMYMVDFNAVPTFPEGLKNTLYQVGKGYIDKIDADGKALESSRAPSAATPAPVAQTDEKRGGENDGAVAEEGAESTRAGASDSSADSKKGG